MNAPTNAPTIENDLYTVDVPLPKEWETTCKVVLTRNDTTLNGFPTWVAHFEMDGSEFSGKWGPNLIFSARNAAFERIMRDVCGRLRNDHEGETTKEKRDFQKQIDALHEWTRGVYAELAEWAETSHPPVGGEESPHAPSPAAEDDYQARLEAAQLAVGRADQAVDEAKERLAKARRECGLVEAEKGLMEAKDRLRKLREDRPENYPLLYPPSTKVSSGG